MRLAFCTVQDSYTELLLKFEEVSSMPRSQISKIARTRLLSESPIASIAMIFQQMSNWRQMERRPVHLMLVECVLSFQYLVWIPRALEDFHQSTIIRRRSIAVIFFLTRGLKIGPITMSKIDGSSDEKIIIELHPCGFCSETESRKPSWCHYIRESTPISEPDIAVVGGFPRAFLP